MCHKKSVHHMQMFGTISVWSTVFHNLMRRHRCTQSLAEEPNRSTSSNAVVVRKFQSAVQEPDMHRLGVVSLPNFNPLAGCPKYAMLWLIVVTSMQVSFIQGRCENTCSTSAFPQSNTSSRLSCSSCPSMSSKIRFRTLDTGFVHGTLRGT